MTKTQARATLARLAANTAIQAVINEWDTLGEAEHYVALQERAQAARRRALDNADAYADTDYDASDRAERAVALKALGRHTHLPWYVAVQDAIAALTAGTISAIGFSRVSKAEWAREGGRLDRARAEVVAWEIYATDAAVEAEAEDALTQNGYIGAGAAAVEAVLAAAVVASARQGDSVNVVPRYTPAPTNVDANAVLHTTFGQAFRALPIAHRDALIADLLDLHQAERHATLEVSARVLADRLAPAPLASYTTTLLAGQAARRRALGARA